MTKDSSVGADKLNYEILVLRFATELDRHANLLEKINTAKSGINSHERIPLRRRKERTNDEYRAAMYRYRLPRLLRQYRSL
jgi:hypothetical protein